MVKQKAPNARHVIFFVKTLHATSPVYSKNCVNYTNAAVGRSLRRHDIQKNKLVTQGKT
jgi:hypothetical protein